MICAWFQTEKKQKAVLDALRKADKSYCESCEKAEVARQEWDFSVNKVGNLVIKAWGQFDD